jgi:hypothetical protein
MSCFTAVILMSSCTVDSIDDTKKKTHQFKEVPTTNASTEPRLIHL